MQLQTNLVRRKANFYFRTRVPVDLKSHYGKNEILISLKTSDKRIACYELAKIKVKLYAEFAQIRGEAFGITLTPRNSNNQSKDTTVPDVNNSTDTVQNVFYSNQTVSNVLHSENNVSNVLNGINPVNTSPNTISIVPDNGPTIEHLIEYWASQSEKL